MCAVHAKALQLCLTVCDLMDCSPSGSSVHGILQARILEWVAISSSRGSCRPRDQTLVSCRLHWQVGSLPPAPPGKPVLNYNTLKNIFFFNWLIILGYVLNFIFWIYIWRQSEHWAICPKMFLIDTHIHVGISKAH